MANTKVTTKVIADDAITSDKLASGLTLGGDTTLSGHVDLADDKRIRLGASDDLQIYHTTTGNHSIIAESGAGNLVLAADHLEINNAANNENKIIATSDGAVTLFHNNQAKIATALGGVTITGTATATTFAGELSGTITSATTGTTQSASDNSTKLATTAYVTTAISNLVDSSPSALNTLNELAAALGDDANFSTTVTNSIATKLPLAGGNLTGNLGIGVANPQFPLDLSTSSTDVAKFTSSGSYTYTKFSNSSRNWAISAGSSFGIYDETASATQLSIDGSGNLEAAGQLTGTRLNITDAVAPYIVFTEGSNVVHMGVDGGSFWIRQNGLAGGDELVIASDGTLQVNHNATFAGNIIGSDLIAAGSGGLSLQTDEGTKRIFIKDNGDVKVGELAVGSATTAPLHVAKASTDVQAIFGDNNSSIDDPSIRIIGRDSGNSAIRYLFTGLDADANYGFIGYNAGAGSFANALHFTTDAKVGVGSVTTPPQTLTVAHQNHGVGIDYVGSSLPDIAGLFTSSTAHTSTAYGDLNIKARTDYGGNYDIGFFTSTNNQTPVLRGAYRAEGDIIHPATERSIADNGILRFTKTASIGASGNDPVFTITKVSYGLYIGGTLTLILVDTSSPWGIQYRRYGVIGRVATYSGGNTMSISLTSEATYSNIDYTPNFSTVDTRTSGQNGGTFVVNMNTANNGTATVKVIFQGYAAGVTLT